MRLVALTLLLAACAPDAEPPPPLPDGPESPEPSGPRPLVYRCESGAEVAVAYPDVETALVTVRGETRSLAFDPTSAEPGATYADEAGAWGTAGSEGTLRTKDGDVVERCRQAP